MLQHNSYECRATTFCGQNLMIGQMLGVSWNYWAKLNSKPAWWVFVRASSMIWGVRPTRCYTMVYWTYNLLNMFRAPLCPSSGACDYTEAHTMWHVTLVMLVIGVVRGCRLCVQVEGCCSSRAATHHTHDQHNKGYVPHAVSICIVTGSWWEA